MELFCFPGENTRVNIIFEGAAEMAEDEQIIKVQPEAVKKGAYCFVRGNPCKLEICEVLPKATANGNKRLHIKGPHVFTGKHYEDTLNLSAGLPRHRRPGHDQGAVLSHGCGFGNGLP